MILKHGFFIVALLALAAFVPFAFADAAEDQQEEAEEPAAPVMYRDQLDGNGAAVYDSVLEAMAGASGDVETTVQFTDAVIFQTGAEAEAYAASVVNDAVAALYYSNPEVPYLWNVPVSGADFEPSVVKTKVGDDVRKEYSIVEKVVLRFSLPEGVEDQKSVADALDVKANSLSFKDSDKDQNKVKAIYDFVSKVKVEDSEEGVAGNAYDALELGKSSSDGVAQAFTYVCKVHGIPALTVKGLYKGEPAYWNMAFVDGGWYIVDVPNSRLLAGASEPVGEKWCFTEYKADLDLSAPNGLTVPAMEDSTFEFPVHVNILEQYGKEICLGLVAAITVLTMLYAVRRGDA